MKKPPTKSAVIALLRSEIEKAGGIIPWSTKTGIEPSTVQEVLSKEVTRNRALPGAVMESAVTFAVLLGVGMIIGFVLMMWARL